MYEKNVGVVERHRHATVRRHRIRALVVGNHSKHQSSKPVSNGQSAAAKGGCTQKL
jgi:hypothetical protein